MTQPGEEIPGNIILWSSVTCTPAQESRISKYFFRTPDSPPTVLLTTGGVCTLSPVFSLLDSFPTAACYCASLYSLLLYDSIVMTLLINSLLLLLCIFATEVLSLSRTQKQLEFSIEDVTKVDTYIYREGV